MSELLLWPTYVEMDHLGDKGAVGIILERTQILWCLTQWFFFPHFIMLPKMPGKMPKKKKNPEEKEAAEEGLSVRLPAWFLG